MAKREFSEQEKQAFRDRMKAAREAKKAPVEEITPEVVKTTITLNFTKPIEVTINGRRFFGTTVEADSMNQAAEIVRLAKGAYGWDILG